MNSTAIFSTVTSCLTCTAYPAHVAQAIMLLRTDKIMQLQVGGHSSATGPAAAWGHCCSKCQTLVCATLPLRRLGRRQQRQRQQGCTCSMHWCCPSTSGRTLLTT